MYLRHLIAILFLIVLCPRVGADPSLDSRIDQAFAEIMKTRVGKAICNQILGAQPITLAFHLGISFDRAKTIASDCTGGQDSPWVVRTAYTDIQKLTLTSFKSRHYFIDSTPIAVPIESWTDPLSNSTYFFSAQGGVEFPRLVQLLAHEMAVYFDSKANPAHSEAQKMPEFRDLRLSSSVGMQPLVAMSDPLIAHTMTFVRALQVEYAIMDELVTQGLPAPPDYEDPYLRYLISDKCQQDCLLALVEKLRLTYLPLALPMMAYAPDFRSRLGSEIQSLNTGWTADQWSVYQRAVNQYPVDYLKAEMLADPRPPLGVIRMFDESLQATEVFRIETRFMAEELWPLELPILQNTKTSTGETLLEFMKRPLLSGYNLVLSSGPRVRVTVGSLE